MDVPTHIRQMAEAMRAMPREQAGSKMYATRLELLTLMASNADKGRDMLAAGNAQMSQAQQMSDLVAPSGNPNVAGIIGANGSLHDKHSARKMAHEVASAHSPKDAMMQEAMQVLQMAAMCQNNAMRASQQLMECEQAFSLAFAESK